MLQSSPAQSPGLRGFSSFSHLDLSSSHSDPGLVADAPEQSPPLQGRAEIFYLYPKSIIILFTLLRASNSGSRTYFINPICAIGLVTRSLQIKWLFSTKYFSQKYFTCPWREPPVNCLSFPCQTAENTLPSNIQPSPVVEDKCNIIGITKTCSPLTPWLVDTHWRCRRPWSGSSSACWGDPRSCSQSCPVSAWSCRVSRRGEPCPWRGSK